MLYVTKLGPITTGDGTGNVYLAVRDGFFLPPAKGTDDDTALDGFTSNDMSELRLCDESLAEAGVSRGFTIAPLPTELVEPVLISALQMSFGLRVSVDINGEIFIELTRASAAFANAAPWQWWSSDEPLEAVVMGGTTFELAIMGANGESFGIALYAASGSIARTSALYALGRFNEAKQIDFLSVSLEKDPDFGVRACQRLTGIDRIPDPLKVSKGQAVPASEDDILILTAALHAVAKLSPARLNAMGRASLGNDVVEVQVSAPASWVVRD